MREQTSSQSVRFVPAVFIEWLSLSLYLSNSLLLYLSTWLPFYLLLSVHLSILIYRYLLPDNKLEISLHYLHLINIFRPTVFLFLALSSWPDVVRVEDKLAEQRLRETARLPESTCPRQNHQQALTCRTLTLFVLSRFAQSSWLGLKPTRCYVEQRLGYHMMRQQVELIFASN